MSMMSCFLRLLSTLRRNTGLVWRLSASTSLVSPEGEVASNTRAWSAMERWVFNVMLEIQ
jgi:hypothetical protein